jgi:hypothetical protein
MDVMRNNDKAARCRRLASWLSSADPAREKLLKLAEEYEIEANQFDREQRHERPMRDADGTVAGERSRGAH